MRRQCEDCGRVYDDVYRLTYCPHEAFAMATTVVRADGSVAVATSVEELHSLFRGTEKM